MARDRVLRIQFEGRGHMPRVSPVLEGMDNAVGIAPVVPTLRSSVRSRKPCESS